MGIISPILLKNNAIHKLQRDKEGRITLAERIAKQEPIFPSQTVALDSAHNLALLKGRVGIVACPCPLVPLGIMRLHPLNAGWYNAQIPLTTSRLS